MGKRIPWPINVSSIDARAIQSLNKYWNDLGKKSDLSIRDFESFIKNSHATLELFRRYPFVRYDLSLRRVEFDVVFLDRAQKIDNWKRLPTEASVRMINASRGFASRIKKYFAPVIKSLTSSRSPIEDAEDILMISNKLTYRWASGIIISNHIASLLMQVLKRRRKIRRIRKDDIFKLYESLKNRLRPGPLRNFLVRGYNRFKDADATRNRCAHVNQGEPTKQEIEQSISLAKLLQKYVRG